MNPPPRVAAVNIILSMNTYHAQLVTKLDAITGAPAPRKSVVPVMYLRQMTIKPAITIRIYGFSIYVE